jgi:tRNA dimethylallyltransferase
VDRPRVIPTLLVLAGPTAAGKSATGLAIAETWGGVVLSADAMQVYRGLDIGTASPSPRERARVRHLGIDVVEPTERFSAADFVRLGDEALALGRPVVVVGGTALYIQALIRGLAPTPPMDPALRARLEALPDPHAALALVDAPLAARLHPNDRKRVIRGLEVHAQSGRRLSDLQAEHAAAPDRVRAVGLWLDRTDLYERIDQRVHDMIAAGYLDEVRRLLDAGVPRDARPMQSLGYRHLCEHLLDGLDLDEAIRRTQRDTRHFARKQRTWRRHLDFDEVWDDHALAAHDAAIRAFGPAEPG